MKYIKPPRHGTCASIVSVLAIIAAPFAPAAAAVAPHSAASQIAPYLMASQRQEIALARSAAPPSIAMHASVMVLSAHGYVTEVKGTNGFVCLVSRSWDSDGQPNQPAFWDPKISVPKCFNAPAARWRLALLLTKTQWVTSGGSEAELGERLKAAHAPAKMEDPPGVAICYMMSKRSWGVGGHPGAWRPHLMFYFPNGHVPNWGANLDGSPVMSGAEDDHTTVVDVLVPAWSDGSPAPGP
ncbi:MAG TPA: hypothetical protein VGT07_01695 [Steroidobacteraceae bacterium]|nr:hypothetical protein [Steroidobacteraceae bacterium]